MSHLLLFPAPVSATNTVLTTLQYSLFSKEMDLQSGWLWSSQEGCPFSVAYPPCSHSEFVARLPTVSPCECSLQEKQYQSILGTSDLTIRVVSALCQSLSVHVASTSSLLHRTTFSLPF